MLALAGVVGAGIASRRARTGWWVLDELAGDVLYAVAAYLGIALVSRRAASVVGPWALGYCVTIELFKLTGLPLAWRRVPGARWILGSVFGWHNLVCYAVGVGIARAVDAVLSAQKPPRSGV